MNKLFWEMGRGFQQALASNRRLLKVRTYLLAGREVRVRYVGRELEPILHSVLAHLETTEQAGADLSIDVWHGRETKTANPLVGNKTNFHLSDEGVVHTLRGSTTVLDLGNRRLTSCFNCIDKASLYELGRPWHAPLSIWHRLIKAPLIHSGAIVYHDRGILVAGPGGSGKTTLCRQAARRGYNFIGDDLVSLRKENGRFLAGSLYASSFSAEKGSPEEIECWRAPRYRYEEKGMGLVRGIKLAENTIHAVVLPRIMLGSRKDSRLVKAKPPQILMGLGPSTHQMGMLNPGKHAFDLMAEMAEKIPGYYLELGLSDRFVLDELLS